MSRYEIAVAELKTAKTVDQWNEIMSEQSNWLTRAERAKIEGEGLIVKVLGRDEIK